MTKLRLILVGLFVGQVTLAQQVYKYSGIVKDKNTDLPLEDALVIVKPLRTSGAGYYSGVKTKADGRFNLTTTYRLPLNVLVSRKGCASSSTKIKRINENSFEIYLECEQETIELIIEETKDNDDDGVINKDDECPNEKGPVENKGCPLPDDDQDGVPNATDECPNEKGPAENNGCPYADDDQDGTPNDQDKCPNVKGSPEFDGCPDPKNELTALLNENRFVFFGLDSKKLSKEAMEFLDSIAVILNQSGSVALEITGHSSSEGSEEYNQSLSESRAKSVSDYLIQNGVKATQLNTRGLGEIQPLESNSTESGRSKNRRVEFKF